MPPKKKKGGGASAKTVQKTKEKIVEDKTFGLKNKNKSKKVQQYVAKVTKQVELMGVDRKQQKLKEDKEKEKKRLKEEKAAKEAELRMLFAPTEKKTKVPVGVDPKSVVCEYFKIGLCFKGNKCKFSHDIEKERKSAKIDIYSDKREAEDDTMENWDQDKLEKVVLEKHDQTNKTIKTKIICKHFLDALEKRVYGFFWTCPAGGDKCIYRHALPPGYVLKTEAKKTEDKKVISLEELIETERAKLKNATPVTEASFKEWKDARKKKKEEEETIKKEEKAKAAKSGRPGLMSGRDLFVFQPDVFVDDDGAFEEEIRAIDEEELEKEDGKDETPIEVDESLFLDDSDDSDSDVDDTPPPPPLETDE